MNSQKKAVLANLMLRLNRLYLSLEYPPMRGKKVNASALEKEVNRLKGEIRESLKHIDFGRSMFHLWDDMLVTSYSVDGDKVVKSKISLVEACERILAEFPADVNASGDANRPLRFKLKEGELLYDQVPRHDTLLRQNMKEINQFLYKFLNDGVIFEKLFLKLLNDKKPLNSLNYKAVRLYLAFTNLLLSTTYDPRNAKSVKKLIKNIEGRTSLFITALRKIAEAEKLRPLNFWQKILKFFGFYKSIVPTEDQKLIQDIFKGLESVVKNFPKDIQNLRFIKAPGGDEKDDYPKSVQDLRATTKELLENMEELYAELGMCVTKLEEPDQKTA